MANVLVLTAFVLSMVMSSVVCQTFQYSHGWTNGKRSVSFPLEELLSAVNKNAENIFINCELHKLRLLLQGNANDQMLQVPCELFARRSLGETVSGQLQRENNY